MDFEKPGFERTTLVIADDHAIFRQGLAGLLTNEPGLELLGQADNGDELLELVEAHRPVVAIADVSMPGAGVADFCRERERAKWPTKLIVLTMHRRVELARQMLSFGADGFVLKKNAFDELRLALRGALGGENFVSPEIASEIATNSGDQPTLTPREAEVVQLVADGHTNRRIAAEMGVSIKTVQTHRARVMEKLNAHSGAELVHRAVSFGLLPAKNSFD